jgi:hypothetical protein
MSKLPSEHKVRGILRGRPLDTLEACINEMDLALTTVQDVVDRNAEDGRPEDSYIGVNLGLYLAHVDATILKCRQLLDQPR